MYSLKQKKNKRRSSLSRELKMAMIALLVTGWFAGCATSEPAVESEEVELESSQEDPSIYPEWFEPGMEGAMADGNLIGYGRAISGSEEQSTELARENAIQGLRYRIDRMLEGESEALQSVWNGGGSMHLAMREAVASLNLDEVAWRTERVSGISPSAAVVAQARIDSRQIADQLVNSLNMESIRSLFEETAE